jgi:hypothetical protein
MKIVALGFAAYLLVVTVLFRGDAERRRTLTFLGLGVCFALLGLVAIVQGQLASGLVALALAGIELGLLALIRATKSSSKAQG